MEEINYQIRPVRPSDLAAVTEVEAVCFPAAEAATKEEFREENRKGNVGAIIMGIALPLAFFAAGIFLLISSGSSGERL